MTTNHRWLVFTFLVLFGSLGSASAQTLYGLDFSPYENGQDPNVNPQVTASQIQARLQIIAAYTQWVRSYSMTNGLENIPPIAKSMNLKVAATAWISSNLAQNTVEINNLISAAQAHNVDIAIVGSEALLRGDVTESQLIAYINQVRQSIPAGILVTTADTYNTLLAHPNVIAASDVIAADIYPYWEDQALSNAICDLISEYNQLVAAAGGKTVIVAETGWPSGGASQGAAISSPTNAQNYLLQFTSWARQNNVQYFYFEAFDEAWKAAYEGSQGAYWGIWDQNGNLKFSLQFIFSAPGYSSNYCNGTPGGPGTPQLSFTYVPPYGNTSDSLEGQVLHVSTSGYGVAIYINVAGGWWTKPTFAEPVTSVQPDGTWSASIVTGGSDQDATQIAAFLIPNSYTPPQLSGASTLPQALYTNSAANVQATRTQISISGQITNSSSAGVEGVTVNAVNGTTSMSTTTAADGKYSFPNLATNGPFTITPSNVGYSFSPATQTFASVAGNQVANFTATSLFPISMSSASLSFHPQITGIVSPSQTILMTNPNGAGVTINGIVVDGTNPAEFTQTNTCGSSLSAYGSCTITVTFMPASTGSRSANLIISGNNSGLPQTVNLHGTGVAGSNSFAAWRPSNGTWFVATQWFMTQQQWGLPGDIPVPGDYDGDGYTDFAIWRPANGTWYVLYRNATNQYPTPSLQQQWGLPGDIPVPGDYDGDGKTDFAVWRPSNGTWHIIPSSNPGAPIIVQWGLPGDIPVPGDFDNDGKADLVVWRPSTGTWFVLGSTSGFNAFLIPTGTQQQWGLPGDIPVSGDFNNDGANDFAVWRPSTGTWFVLYSTAANQWPAPSIQQQWGLPGDNPLGGDFNADGHIDFTVWRPTTGTWFVLFSTATAQWPAASLQQQWGLSGDIPLLFR